MTKKEDIKEAGTSAAGRQEPEKPAVTEIETVEDLEACYPHLVSKIKDETVGFIKNRTALQIKEKLPELYQRIVLDIQNKSGPNLNVPGFLLEVDDPFAPSTLEKYGNMKGLDELLLPYVLPFGEKGKGEISGARWKMKFEKSEALKSEFKDVAAYIAFKSKIIVQVLEFYILVAEGGGDYVRADAARKAMKKIK